MGRACPRTGSKPIGRYFRLVAATAISGIKDDFPDDPGPVLAEWKQKRAT
jgi:hypothetical protein